MDTDTDTDTTGTTKIRHRSVNACLFPALAAHNCHITTIEGIGDTSDLHPIQTLMVQLHGSQCGFCTPGIVMSLFASSVCAVDNDESMPHVDGNLCRCTGYRPIWDVMRCLADNDEFDQCTPEDCAKCETQHCRGDEETKQECCDSGNGSRGSDDSCCSSTVRSSSADKVLVYKQLGSSKVNDKTRVLLERIEFLLIGNQNKPGDGLPVTRHLTFRSRNSGPCGSLEWIQPRSLTEMMVLLSDPSAMLVSGNTEVGIDVKFKNTGGVPHFKRYVYPNCVRELYTIDDTSTLLTIGANVDLTSLSSHCKSLKYDSPIYSTISNMLEYFASRQIRNVASIAGNVATASPISDLCPVLLCLDSNIRIVSMDKKCDHLEPHLIQRDVALSDFFLSYRRTQLKPGEVIKCIEVPKYMDKDEENIVEFCMPFKQAR